MGILEKESKRRTRNKNLKKIILQTVAVAGLLGITFIAPGVMGAIGKMGLIPTRRQLLSIYNSRQRLVKNGLLQYEGKFLRLTPKGQAVLEHLEFLDYKISTPRHWDKKWRVLVFDIPEKRKTLRDKVRRTLASMGFVRLQDSVWVFPYDCEDYINLLKADFKIGKDIIYMIVDSIENDKKLKEFFGLPEIRK